MKLIHFNSTIPPEWLFVVGILVILVVSLLFCDTGFTDKNALIPQSQSIVSPWTYLEPPETRKRMLWIIHGYVPMVNAGSEICAHTINRFFMQKPYEYDVWVAAPGCPNITYEGVRCFDLYDTDTLTKVINSSQVLHSHSYIYRKQMMYLSRKTGIPFVEWVHTDNYVRSISKNAWIDPRIQDRHWTVFNSKSLRDTRKDITEESTHVMNPVVDYRLYSVDEKERTPVYVTLSNVNENKGGKLLIQLAKALPEFQFQGVLGGYRTQIIQHGIPNLRYISNTTQIKDIYAQTWVMIMPSREETWGRTAVEAMASGIPIIVATTPGLKECCEDAALYCNRDDVGEWVSALKHLKEDREYYNSRSAAAYARARALDPHPALEELESWMGQKVFPTRVEGQPVRAFENNLLFR